MADPSHNLTMREIAVKAGVSASTVSKCLANKPDVSARTRARVLRICKQAGYRPNPLVSALMQVRRRKDAATPTGLTVAFVTAFDTPDGWQKHASPIFRQMHAGALARARERNYKLEHFWLHQDGMSSRRFGQMLHARGIRGILLAPVPATRLKIDPSWSALSVVALGLMPGAEAFHRVTTDYFQGMRVALEHCLRSGYKRPGFAVRGETNERLDQRWHAAFELLRAGTAAAPLPAPLIVDEWTEQAVLDWLSSEQPDCIIGPVLGRLEEILRSSGHHIPRDIGIIGLLVPSLGDRLSGIVQNGELIGSVAIDQLISQIERNETGPAQHPIIHTLPGDWNPGTTTAQQPTAQRKRHTKP